MLRFIIPIRHRELDPGSFCRRPAWVSWWQAGSDIFGIKVRSI